MVTGLKQRTLLAVLVLHANRVVSHDRLLSALWGADVPANGRRLLHNHLWSLRRLLDDDAVLAGTATGYSLQIHSDASDLGVFGTETALGRSALSTGDAVQASKRFTGALTLWRGPALGGTHPELQASEGAALEESRVAALISRIEADLALGRHAELVGELRGLVTENPLDETLRGQLMRALHHVGRTAEALEEFRLGRQHFRDEFGLEPGEGLSRLHQAILSGNLESERPEARQTASVSAPRAPERLPSSYVPRQLPADILRFTGRADQLLELDTLLSEEPRGRALVLSAVAGAAGVGKTALVTHWGHRVASRFPDGQLYINLHGYSQGGLTPPSDALHYLLQGLGVANDEIPQDVDQRTALYRSLLADRRLLIVLDNAATPDQVRPLLPGSSPSRVVITSRDSLRGLFVTHDVHGIVLDVLSPAEASALLTSLLGPTRADLEIDSLAELARLCGHLPLALRLAAAQLTGRPALRVGDLVAKLGQENRLNVLDLEEDPHIGVRAAFGLSYRSLPGTTRRLFRLLGTGLGPSVSLHAAAALSGLSLQDTEASLNRLATAHLIQPAEEGRWQMHDLLRVYAAERARSEEPETELDAVQTRLFDWYLHTAGAAADRIDANRIPIDVTAARPHFPGPVLGTLEQALNWLETERPALVAAIHRAAAEKHPTHSWQLACTLWQFFAYRGHTDDWFGTHRHALETARALNDATAEAYLLETLGHAHRRSGNYREAIDHYLAGKALRDRSDDLHGEGRVSNALALTYDLLGEFSVAGRYYERALKLFREVGDQTRETTILSNLGIFHARRCQFDKAMTYWRQALTYFSRMGDPHSEAGIHANISTAGNRLVQPDLVIKHSLSAIDLYRGLSERRGEVLALTNMALALTHSADHEAAARALDQAEEILHDLDNLEARVHTVGTRGAVHLLKGDFEQAVPLLRQALELNRDLSDPHIECETTNRLGRAYSGLGDHRAAITHHLRACAVANRVDDRLEMGHAHRGVADGLEALGDHEDAEKHRGEARAIFTDLGMSPPGSG
ncbi:AfsR/SARP family transcriptional regulator [Streptosporangium carneum]|uniref:XRE family transcriptional regulator n=1 Tax=Streptosporangium carneum TaxID=47481 RepID=A0A9W6MI62_9ACTN|nr:BTAD domain-containing putative transcriptional regulator [Streptosporangium carneum]GLK14922.1 XRE family transcriptional regulator [Streptosporangium carneum]